MDMNSLFRTLRKDSKGQALVEMALILPILILLVFGITEFGRVFSTHLIVNHSAREGARQATVGASDAVIKAKVKDSALILDNSLLAITITPNEATRKKGESVKVKVTYPVNIYAPIISNFIGNPYIASGEVIMRVE